MQTSSFMGLTIFWAKKLPFCLRCFEFLSLATIAYTIRCPQKVHILLGTGLSNLMKVYWRRIWTRVCFSSYIDNYCLAVCRFFRSKCKIRRYCTFEINDILKWCFREADWDPNDKSIDQSKPITNHLLCVKKCDMYGEAPR